MNKIASLFKKYSEVISYLFFGVLTTLVNFVVFWACGLLLSEELYLVSNAIAWIAAVIFAYITNKLFVFQSKSWALKVIISEIPEFLGARVFSFLIEEAGLWLLVDILSMGKISFSLLGIGVSGQMIAKIILAVIVVILNYFFSKFIIFKKKTEQSDETSEKVASEQSENEG